MIKLGEQEKTVYLTIHTEMEEAVTYEPIKDRMV